jgi:broad specificity phosphatase PhoE
MNLQGFFYLRHGQSEANLAGLMCGRNCDSPLTRAGREQARLALVQRIRVALSHCAAVNQPTLIVSHGGVWMAVQQILGLEPIRSENAIPYKLQRQANQWALERLK